MPVSCGDIASTSYQVVAPYDGTGRLLPALCRDRYLVVKDEEEFVGILTIADYLQAPRKLVIDCLRPKARIDCESDLSSTCRQMLASAEAALPVFRNEVFFGVITDYDIAAALLRNCARWQELEEKTSDVDPVRILAAGIGHDFNNYLTAVLAGISQALTADDLPESLIPPLHAAEKGIMSARRLSRQLLDLAHEDLPDLQKVDLARLVRESAGFFAAGSGTAMHFSFPEELWFPCLSPDRFNQVVQNLVINAVQAMAGSGELWLSAANLSLDGNEDLPLEAGDYVVLTIRDNGPGIPRKYLGKIFDPHFTTKKSGSGLGLAIVKSVILKHKGYITVDSTLGEGTRFEIYLAASRQAAPEELPPQLPFSTVRRQSRRKRILLLDDNDALREMLATYFNRIGHEIEVARDGEEALRLFRQASQAGTPYGVLILDLLIPGGRGGGDIIDEIRAQDPEVRAIAASGLPSAPEMENFRQHGFDAAIAKPFELGDIRRLVDSL
ncbi:MAG: ATP-binding protein [Thermodesulfobacteriota bacterium]